MNKQIQLSAQPISNHECFTMLDLHENLTRLRTEADDGWKWELKDQTHGKVEWQDCFWDLYKDWGAQVIKWDQDGEWHKIKYFKTVVLADIWRGKLWWHHFLYSTAYWNYYDPKDTRVVGYKVAPMTDTEFLCGGGGISRKDSKFYDSHKSQLNKGQKTRFVTPAER